MFKLRKVTKGGTKLILDPKKSDYVDFNLYVGVGQKDNVRYDQTAHLLEHMVALNCEELFDYAINFGAETWFDFTKYYFKSKKEDFIEHFDLFIDKLVNFTIDDIGFKNEKKVVDIEMNSARNDKIHIDDNLENLIFDSNYVSSFKKEFQNLFLTKDISKEYLLVFFKKHYTADNMVVSLQTDDENIIKHVEQGLEKLSKLKRLLYPFENNEKQEEPSLFYSPIQNYFVNQNNCEDSKVILRIPSVSKKHRLYTASLLYSSYLTNSQFLSSILVKELRGKRGLVYAIFSELITEGNLNFLEISYQTFSDNVKKVNSLIRRVIDDIAQKGLTREEFEKLKKYYIKRSEYSLDSDSEEYLNDVCVKLLKTDKTKGVGLKRADYIDWVKNTTLEEFNSYAKHISKIKNYFVIGSGKNMSRKDLMSFKNLKQKDYKNDYYYENMLTQGEKREYIKTLQASGVKNLAKQERGLVENKKYTMKSEEQEK